jgi:hypothetical protein
LRFLSRINDISAHGNVPNLQAFVIARAEGPWQSMRFAGIQSVCGLPRRFAPENDNLIPVFPESRSAA